MGFWLSSPEAGAFRTDEFHRGLLADRFLNALSGVAPASVSAYRYEDQRYFRLEYSGGTTNMFAAEADIVFGEQSDPDSGETALVSLEPIDVWVDAATHLLTKVSVRYSVEGAGEGSGDAAHDQVFLDYDGGFEIEAPTDATDNRIPEHREFTR